MYRIKALLRFLLFILALPFITVWTYASPADVAGYLGGINIRTLTLAFVTADGRLQFYW